MTAISRVTISVEALDRALPVYEGALGLARRYAVPGLVMLATDDGVEVLLHERTPTPGDFGVAPSFRVDDVDQVTEAALLAGASVVDSPADQPWGERQSVLHDPDGHVFCLVAPLVG
ncbi:VOC family protein [Lysinimonas soli]|uniref:VOC family protein n=1 Tax=Lysinimonas soli TaxID=1074233 RepID=A0ABW0NLU1_9MICO